MSSSSDTSKTAINKFEEFFQTVYKDKVFNAIPTYPDERSFIIEYPILEKFDSELCDLLVEKPEDVINAAQIAIKNIDPQMKDVDFNIRIEGDPNQIPLRILLSAYIGRYVTCDGIVRKTDEIRPRIETAMYECRGCMRLHEVPQTTNTLTEPVLCPECGGRSFKLLQEESVFIDTQTGRIQEPLENLSGGTEPKQMLIILEDDLVDTINPGDSIRVSGILRTFREERTGKFKNYIYVNHIEQLEQEFEELKISDDDEKEILELAKDPNIYDKIIASTAPSIKGYRDVKEAIAFQLFGGASKELDDKTRLRGDIHILIVGDPGIGKSQMLKYVSKLAPRSMYTSGKGTSGAGLTAAAVRDELGGWSLEAGALVLGDMGNVCIDELDKMRPEDRSALHEALEQQTISIAKAGIMATLNARCSVLAAANPKFGRFDSYKSVAEQIELPSTILSRFDLTFVVEDKPDMDKDRDLAQHILKMHQDDSMPFEIEPELLRKYIAYARIKTNPVLSDEAMKVLEEFYVSMRSSAVDEDSPVPITARQLEAVIRLSEASAKIKLKDTVEAEDAKRAITLQKRCLEQVGYDSETGTIDIDKVEGRTPKSERNKLRIVSDMIDELCDEYDGKAPIEILTTELVSEHNMSEDQINKMLEQLRQKGEIYEPSNGYLKKT